MKRFGFLIAMCIPFLLAANLLAGEVKLQWNPNSEADLGRYNVYYGKASRQYGAPLSAGNSTSFTVNGLTDGAAYYFAVTAVDNSGNESGFSSEVKKAAAATTATPSSTYKLMLSRYANRSSALALQGQTASGNAYIFLTPTTNIKAVSFSSNGRAISTDTSAPYDLMGGSLSTANPLDTRKTPDGTYETVAKVTLNDGSSQTVKATFTVANQTVAPPAPAPTITYQLMLSRYANRSSAVALQGQTASGNAYIFLTPTTNIKAVSFSANGRAISTDTSTPYDLMGGSLSAANPLDTRKAPNGTYETVAKVTLSDGTTKTIKATFTAKN